MTATAKFTHGTHLQGRSVSTTAPTDAQALLWDDATKTWKPGTVATGSTSPGGSDTQVQINNSGSFGGAANVTYAGGLLSIAAAGAIAFGSGPAAGGAIRLSNAQGIGSNQNPSSANTITLVITDSSNNVYFGDASYGAITYLRSPSQVDLRIGGSTKASLVSGSLTMSVPILMGSNYMQYGATPAASGDSRHTNGAEMVSVKSTGSGTHTVLLSDSNNVLVGANDAFGTSTLSALYMCANTVVNLTAAGSNCFQAVSGLAVVPNGINLSVGALSPTVNSATNSIILTSGTAPSGGTANEVFAYSSSGKFAVMNGNTASGGSDPQGLAPLIFVQTNSGAPAGADRKLKVNINGTDWFIGLSAS